MAQTTDSALSTIHSDHRVTRMLAGLLGYFRHTREPQRPIPEPGPMVEALIDADIARLASHGSWDALRDDLRQRARSRGSKAA